MTRQLYSPREIQVSQKILKDIILFLHASSGYETTSAAFQKGKLKLFELIESDDLQMKMQGIIECFNDPVTAHEYICRKGSECFLALYSAQNSETSSSKHRFHCFMKSKGATKLNLASLLLSEEAARQHSYKVYHQDQVWHKKPITVNQWCWKFDKT